jgi:hypothetical protein
MDHLYSLLQLHIEAVWYVQLATELAHQPDQLACREVGLDSTSIMPDWQLCLAQPIAPDLPRIAIWRSDVLPIDRVSLLTTANAALHLSPELYREHQQQFPGLHREVAFQQIATPTITIDAAKKIARQITPEDKPLVETFEPGSSSYYFAPARQPLVGIVIADQLLSLAHSSRRTNEACELGIDTLPQARRKGYALATTLLWTQAVQTAGLQPIYSASIENTASLALAHSAGYRAFAHVVTL